MNAGLVKIALLPPTESFAFPSPRHQLTMPDGSGEQFVALNANELESRNNRVTSELRILTVRDDFMRLLINFYVVIALPGFLTFWAKILLTKTQKVKDKLIF
jgi:hypothetical protein